MWVTGYLGTTSIASYEANVFAKFDANSYFTLSLEINSSKNSKTQWHVPYLPDLRISAGLSLQVSRGLRIFPSVAYVGRRVPDLYVASKLKEHAQVGLRAEYSALEALDVFLDFQNATDSRYEEWSGYRAAPLVITAGIGYRW
jgi:outer membrane receptor protein involved in Fe transport